jgi:hypothetical protein
MITTRQTKGGDQQRKEFPHRLTLHYRPTFETSENNPIVLKNPALRSALARA